MSHNDSDEYYLPEDVVIALRYVSHSHLSYMAALANEMLDKYRRTPTPPPIRISVQQLANRMRGMNFTAAEAKLLQTQLDIGKRSAADATSSNTSPQPQPQPPLPVDWHINDVIRSGHQTWYRDVVRGWVQLGGINGNVGFSDQVIQLWSNAVVLVKLGRAILDPNEPRYMHQFTFNRP